MRGVIGWVINFRFREYIITVEDSRLVEFIDIGVDIRGYSRVTRGNNSVSVIRVVIIVIEDDC